jgi:hypothetical protein
VTEVGLNLVKKLTVALPVETVQIRPKCRSIFGHARDSRLEIKRELLMRLRLALLGLIAFSNSALAQYGVSNQRNAQGNLVRDSGVYSPTGINQGPVNNGPIKDGPAHPPTTNVGTNKGANR